MSELYWRKAAETPLPVGDPPARLGPESCPHLNPIPNPSSPLSPGPSPDTNPGPSPPPSVEAYCGLAELQMRCTQPYQALQQARRGPVRNNPSQGVCVPGLLGWDVPLKDTPAPG